MTERLIFLNSHRAKSGVVNNQTLDPAYVLLAKFFGCGPLDRTGTLDIGAPYTTLQPIPEERTRARFSEVCAAVAETIVLDAIATDRAIQVAWSGGIDSTVALIALTKALRTHKELDRLRVYLSMDSMYEYPRFYEDTILGHLQTHPLPVPLPRMLREDAITVTGEHGAQLFGRDHLAGLVKGGVAHLPYPDVIPFYITQKLKLAKRAKQVMAYLAPQIAAAPVPIKTAFDYLWWCNFSLKWQQVSLRMLAFRQGHVGGFYPTTRHFFADPRFQAWSLSNPQVRQVRDWRAYKLEAKQVILDATGDFDYFTHKEKSPSLKNVLVDRNRQGEFRYRVHLYEDFEVHFESFKKQNKNR